MIPFDFAYCRPQTPEEAAAAFAGFRAEGKNPVYYAGGSEIITRCRAGGLRPGAVIDIKGIPDCTRLGRDGDDLVLGAACTLNQVKESGLFGLLTLACGRIADHTNQCRITLGGNVCGTIRYREAALPLLLADARATLFGEGGPRTVPFQSLFQGGQLLPGPGELLVELRVPGWAPGARHFHVKRTANEKIDYPLVSLAALEKAGALRAAFSGLCAHPFRSAEVEAALNDRSRSPADRADRAAGLLPGPACSDGEASGEYRVFIFKHMVRTLLEEWENDGV